MSAEPVRIDCSLKGETLFVDEFLIRTVDSFVVASTARENNRAPGVCGKGLEGTQVVKLNASVQRADKTLNEWMLEY